MKKITCLKAVKTMVPHLSSLNQMSPHFLRLCLVTNISSSPSFSYPRYEKFILNAALGGVTSVQLRFKNQSLSSIRPFALNLKAILAPLKIPLIINDNVQLALDIQADGVHLGQSDISPVEARHILGPDKIIGWSIESLDELQQANKFDCLNYVAASAVFPSKTKTDCKKFWGLDGLKEMVQSSRYPIVGIGGININNIRQVVQHGAAGVAVISAIHDADDPRVASEQLISLITQHLGKKTDV